MACKTPLKFFPPLKTPALVAKAMSGKVALVTGGGTGIGKAIATTFAALGADVTIAARRLDVLEKTAEEIRQKTGAKVLASQMDVREVDSVKKTMDQIESKFHSLPTVVVNGAAGNFIMATERLSPNAVKTVVDIVLMGTVNVTVELGKRLIENPKDSRGCAFLMITTPYARHGAPFVVPSAISKAGVENMTRCLATEWAKYGMRFNAIAPGPVPTEGAMGRLSTMTIDEASQKAASTIPLGRCGEPEEIANLAAFMCSDYGSWLNGSLIDMDGGQQFMNHGSSFGPQLHNMSTDDWANIESLIRGRTGKKKA